jgi:cobalt-zinc-cadmium efflux system protein
MPHNHNGHNCAEGNISLAFFLNLAFAVIEFVGGFMTNSIAIISDAFHDLGDSLSLALAWFFQRKSRKPPTERYTYGFRRFSVLGALITAAALTLGSAYILSEAVPRLINPQETNAAGMFALAVVGIVVNGIAALRVSKGKSVNERLVTLHLLEDVLGWVAVLIGSTVMYFTGWTIIDPILSIIIAAFILFNVIRNIRQIIPVIMQGTDVDTARIAALIKSNPQVSGITDLRIWSLDGEHNVLTARIILKPAISGEEKAELKSMIRNALEREDIRDVTLEL